MLGERSMDQSFIQKTLNILNANLGDENFGVSELARSIGLSRSQLHRKLRNLVGKSSSKFIREYRLLQAMNMLKNSDATASEIAYSVGFNSPTYFNSSFKKLYGFPPGEVKHRNRSAASIGIEGPETLENQNKGLVRKGYKKRSVILLASIVFFLVAGLAYFVFLPYVKGDTSINNTAVISKKSIAVLPFKNFSGDASMDFFCDGMTDEVISRLSKIGSISKVSSRTSVFGYKETKKSMPEIASELGVSHILEGNFQKSGDKIKIRLQLINGPLDDHFWTQEYSGVWDSNDIFTIQTEVAENVAKQMDVEITDSETIDIKKRPTYNNEAYQNYLLAQSQKYKSNQRSFENAIPLYENAIALDSNFVEAYVGLADIWMTGGLVWGIYPEREAWANGKKALEKALKINKDFEGLDDMLYSGYFYYDWDFDRVELYYQKRKADFIFDRSPAIEGDYAIKTGKYKEAIRVLDKNIAIDPSIGIFYTFKGEALMLLGKRKEAIDLLETSIPLYSDNWFYLRESAKLLYYLGDYPKSREQLRKLTTNFPDYPPILMWFKAVYAQMDGKENETENHLNQLKEEYAKGSSGSPAWFMALYYAVVKDYDKTFHWLQKSYENHDVELTWFREEPLLQSLKDDPRYIALYDKIGFSKLDELIGEE